MKKKLLIVALCSVVASLYALPNIESQPANSKYKSLNNPELNRQNNGNRPSYGNEANRFAHESSGQNANSSQGKATAKDDPNKVVLNFENADIQTVIKAISKLSGKNFVIDPRVKGTVNIVSDKPVSKADSYKVLESALRMQGFASVEADGVIKVLPEADARTYGMKTEDSLGGEISKKHQLGDQVITKVFVIQHGSATALVNALRPLVAPNNSIGVYPNSNAIIVTDYSSNVKRIAKVISQLTATDEGTAIKPQIVELHNAVAADVQEILDSYLHGGGSSGGGMGGYRRGGSSGNADAPNATITVDANANSLIIYSPIQSTTNELVGLAQRIDQESQKNNNNLHVVYLRNADAEHVADILRDVMEKQEDPSVTASSTLAKFASEPTSSFNNSSSSGGGSGSPSGGSSTPQSTAQSAAKPVSSSKGGSNNENKPGQPTLVIQADPSTNSLIIDAPQAIYRNMRMIIDMLDVRRAQVMVEAMIADINQTQEGTFGIQWLTGAGTNNGGVVGVGNYGGTTSSGANDSLSGMVTNVAGIASSLNPASQGLQQQMGSMMGNGGMGGGGATIPTLPNEMYVGLVTGTVSIGGQTVPGLTALADMIEANNAGNILSRPTIITMDNEEARIMVGQNIGIPNGSIMNGAFPGAASNTITRQDLGTILQIKPLITQSGAIQLDVYQEDSSVEPGTMNSNNGPTFLERKLRSTLLVDDGQIIALGGMTQDEIILQQDGIPGLQDIPYIGWLFSWQHRRHTKTNLVLFLRPVIIKNADGYKALTNQRYNYVLDRENAVQAKGNAMLPGINAVTLDNQLPYNNKISPQNNPSLNLNKNLPIVDMTHDGKNFDGRKAQGAVTSSTTVVKSLPNNNLQGQ